MKIFFTYHTAVYISQKLGIVAKIAKLSRNASVYVPMIPIVLTDVSREKNKKNF